MNVIQLSKETSERSETQNWVLEELASSSDFYYAGFEGCNENSSFIVTAILDRASIKVEGDINVLPDSETVKKSIIELEGNSIWGKIQFCHLLGIGFSYILYNYEHQFVLRYEFNNEGFFFRESYSSFEAFSKWIQTIKQWTSKKKYREKNDLPEFDKALRRAGCPWPTNIDCVVYHKTHKPIALIEFQNAKKTKVASHSNNAFFFPNYVFNYQYLKPGQDEQRWRSQEILRLQSRLPHFTIVWSQNEDVVIMKQLDQVTFPDYDHCKNKDAKDAYMKLLHDYYETLIKGGDKQKYYNSICNNTSSYYLNFVGGVMRKHYCYPPLSIESKTLPSIYGERFQPSRRDQFRVFAESIFNKSRQLPFLGF